MLWKCTVKKRNIIISNLICKAAVSLANVFDKIRAIRNAEKEGIWLTSVKNENKFYDAKL